MGGAKLWDFFSGDGLDDAPEISSLSVVAAKLGVYYVLTDTALQRCRRNGVNVEDWKNLQRERRLGV